MKHNNVDIDEILRRYFSSSPTEEEIEAAGQRVLKRIRAEVFGATSNESEALKTERLREFDQLVLRAVHLLRGEGYSVSIAHKVNEFLSKRVMLASIHVALDSLERRGLVFSSVVHLAGESASKERRCYQLTANGELALAQATAAARALRDPLEDLT